MKNEEFRENQLGRRAHRAGPEGQQEFLWKSKMVG